MSDVSETTKHATREEAEAAKDKFLSRWAHVYFPSARIRPDDPANPEGPCTLYTSRADSC